MSGSGLIVLVAIDEECFFQIYSFADFSLVYLSLPIPFQHRQQLQCTEG